MNNNPLDEEAIFNVARKMPAESRADYLQQACGDDDALSGRVTALLHVTDEHQEFLEQPASPAVATFDMPPISEPITEQVGDVIGPYKLREQIGEGGMGVVYVAEQEQPIRRKVALKIIKPGMDSQQVLARFEAERQALAMMDHPNIAKVFDAGTTGGGKGDKSNLCEAPSGPSRQIGLIPFSAGRPYFVMELVRGLPITEYCDDAKLPTRERLELFITVCRAVQHAHLKGIIHRDIKPSNVLVTQIDGAAVPKIIDFGVAKAINQQLSEATIYTQFAQMIGTPLYMSPEQAEMSGVDVDTRSDVYSLGVLLYELLTGMTPFDKETLRKAAFDEMRRMIREDEPPRPSDRLSTLTAEKLSTVSDRRAVDGRKLSQSLRGEVDWIVMKALEKDRNRRYESASDFAADLERHLKDEPVEACPPSAGYRCKKFARRNKAAITTASVVALALILGIIGTAWQAVRATKAEALALRQHEREQAALEKEANERLGIDQKLNDAIAEVQRLKKNAEAADLDDPESWAAVLRAAERSKMLIENELASRDLVARATRQLAALDGAEKDRRMLKRLDDIRLMQAEVDTARNSFATRAALPEYRTAFDDFGLAVDTLSTAQAARRIQNCSPMLQRSLIAGMDRWRQLETWYGKDSEESKQRRGWLLAVVAEAENDPWMKQARDAIDQQDFAALRSLAESVDVSTQPAQTLVTVASALFQNEEDHQVAIALLRRACIDYPDDFWIHNELAQMYQRTNPPRQELRVRSLAAAVAIRPRSAGAWTNLGLALSANGESEYAFAAQRKAISLQPDFALAHFNLGKEFEKQGQTDKAIAAYRKAVEVLPNSVQTNNELGLALARNGQIDEATDFFRRFVALAPDDATAHHNLGSMLALKKQWHEAIVAFRTTIRLRSDNVIAHSDLGNALERIGEIDEAISAYSDGLKLDPNIAVLQFNLGSALARRGKIDKAIAAFREAIRIKPDFVLAYFNLGNALGQKRDDDGAIAAFRKVIEFQPDHGPAHYTLGVALATNGKTDEGIAILRKAIKLQPNHAYAHLTLGSALAESGKTDEAIAAFRGAIKVQPDLAYAHGGLAAGLTKKEKYDEAIASYQEAIKLMPNFAWAHTGLSLLFATATDRTKRDPKQAIASANKAIAIDPGSAGSQHALGIGLYRQGDFKAAIEAFEKADHTEENNKRPEDDDLKHRMFFAMAHWKLNNKDKARALFAEGSKWIDANGKKRADYERYRKEAMQLGIGN